MFAWWKLGRRTSTEALPFPAGASLHTLRYVVLDTELTSLDNRSNRLLSLGAIAMDGPRILIGQQFYRLVNPGVPVPPETVLIHKLRSEDLQDAQPVSAALHDFCRFIQGAVLVGHFLHIDLKILRKELTAAGHKLNNPAIDTARVHHWLLRHGPYFEDLPVQLERLDLATLAKIYHLDQHDAHHALYDAFLAARAWQKMIHLVQARGLRTLGDVQRIARA